MLAPWTVPLPFGTTPERLYQAHKASAQCFKTKGKLFFYHATNADRVVNFEFATLTKV